MVDRRGTLWSFPSEVALARAIAETPEFMRPNRVPYAIALEGILNDEDCDAILEKLNLEPPYAFSGCGAVTREIHADPVLDMIEIIARNINRTYFRYDLDPGQHSWMQTYEQGEQYQLHMDGSPGQSRKMTAVALLSDPRSYDGGDLALYVNPKSFQVPRTRGTVVVFQPWIEHAVTQVSAGTRQTVNMGFWGPPFQ